MHNWDVLLIKKATLGYPRKEQKASGNVAMALFYMRSGMKEYSGDISSSFKAYSKISKLEDKGAKEGFVLLNEGHDLMIHGNLKYH